MKKYTITEHFIELKLRIFRIILSFFLCFIACYYYSDDIFVFLLRPLSDLNSDSIHKIIYTGLTEAFFTYIKVATVGSLILIIPIIAIEFFLFIKTALYPKELKYAYILLGMSPLLFWMGNIFVYYILMPKAWKFFISFENSNIPIPLVLEAKISEYINLIIELIFAFGLAFQMPIIILILFLFNLIKVSSLQKKRKIAIIINFIIAGIITPPDVLSQLALAMPMLVLYEISIIICKFIENRGTEC